MGLGNRSDVPHDGDSDDVLRGVVGISVGVLSDLFSERKVDEEVCVWSEIVEKGSVCSGLSNIVETFLVKNDENLLFLRK